MLRLLNVLHSLSCIQIMLYINFLQDDKYLVECILSLFVDCVACPRGRLVSCVVYCQDHRHLTFSYVTYTDGDESWAEKQQHVLERARKRALGSSVMQELREEYFDRPSEVSHRDVAKATLVQQLRHKEE